MIQTYGQIALTQDTTKAMEFFQIATELYPASFRGYDRLGSLWLAKGDRGKARQAFEASLARNPGNANAKEQLKKLGQ
jgi:tetratricopeptide (TPR) repeat protein